MAALTGKVKNLGMWIAFGVILVAAVVGVIFGVVTHDEPTFVEDAAIWADGAFPLKVQAYRYTAEGSKEVREHSDIEVAVSWANRRFGFAVFEYPSREPDVVVTLGAPAVVDAFDAEGGYAVVMEHDDGTAFACEVATVNVPVGLEVQVLLHEFGHCLGLAHDDYTQSVMYPVAREYDGIPPWYTDMDREAVRERYAP